MDVNPDQQAQATKLKPPEQLHPEDLHEDLSTGLDHDVEELLFRDLLGLADLVVTGSAGRLATMPLLQHRI
ncbi:hypothetical protein HCA58_16815 [Micromonospora sp. HNM0581]|uniref:hypothetical protein n=1 Tax=Micromonospora sp. HNM0581 TaxID=2716341 RepID=UPI00146C1F2F|nr:hypothetical protein [Micromonospora sp. HNM0581]NLU80018.1 hypothetical protein [Micromonospora sp. HNM0581]